MPYVIVRFMTLSGKFDTERQEQFSSIASATAAVEQHAQTGGYTHVKLVYGGEDPTSRRFTARTPNERGGRNIAFLDFCDPPSSESDVEAATIFAAYLADVEVQKANPFHSAESTSARVRNRERAKELGRLKYTPPAWSKQS